MLQSHNTVTCGGINLLAAASVITTLEFSSNQKTHCGDLLVSQASAKFTMKRPVVFLNLQPLFSKTIEFCDAIETSQAFHSETKITAGFFPHVAVVEQKLFVQVEGFRMIAIGSQFIGLRAIIF